MKTGKHKNSTEELKVPRNKQQTLTACINQREDINSFNSELCEMMLRCNIPLHNFEVPEFRNFFKKHLDQTLVSRRTICRTYVPRLYEERMEEIRTMVKNKYIWISVDETTDSVGRYIANLIVGVLDGNASPCYLVAVGQLAQTNNLTVARFVNESLTRLYLPGAVPHEKIVMIVTDAASYMIKAAQHLKIFFPNLFHVTCVAHGMNRIAEAIRAEYPLVNKLISNVKKIFLKAPLRVEVYRNMLPDIPLPPQPVITRWGTWIEAALFYAVHYDSIKNVVNEFTSESAEAIGKCQSLFKKLELKSQLTHIKTYFSEIPNIIKKLETRNLLLTESIELTETLKNSLRKDNSLVGKHINAKVVDVFEKNNGFSMLVNIKKVIEGEAVIDENLPQNITNPEIISFFKYAPVTSCDVERSFSKYKNLLENNRKSFGIENIEKHMIIYCKYE